MKLPKQLTFLPSKSDMEVHNHYKKGKLLEKIDIFVLAFVLVGIIVALVFTLGLGGINGSYAEVFYNGEHVYTFELNSDTEITLDNVQGSPTICVKGGAIAIIDNDCPSQTCVKTGYISKRGERIVCAPNKIVIVVRGYDESDGYDGVTGGGGQ